MREVCLAPIHYKDFEKYLSSIGCVYVRTVGDHNMWRRKDLSRPIVVRIKKDLPVFEIKSNLRTLGISTEDFLKSIEKSNPRLAPGAVSLRF